MIDKDELPPFIYLLFLVFTTQNFMRSLKAKSPVNKKAKRRFMSLYNYVKCELDQRHGLTKTFAQTFDILGNYLKHNHRMLCRWNDVTKVNIYEQIAWTDEEIQVWKLILFYASGMVDFIPKVDDEELLSKLKSEVKSLRRKEYKETDKTESTKLKKTVKQLSVEFASFMATRRILQKRAVVVMNASQEMQTARDVAYADSMIQQNAHVVQSATPVRKVVESALNAMSMMNVLANL